MSWSKLVECLKSFRKEIPIAMRDTLDAKGDEVIKWLEEEQPTYVDVYLRKGPTKRGKEYELTIKSKPEWRWAIQHLQFGEPGRGGMDPKPFTLWTPEEVARVYAEKMNEKAIWEAGGRRGPNPFTDEAKRKLGEEGRIIIRGPIPPRPATRYIDKVMDNRLAEIEDNFAKTIVRVWNKSMAGLK